MKIPFLNPDIRQSDIALMTRSIKSGWLVHGPYTEKLERELAAYLGIEYVIMTGSATAALHMSLILAGVEDDDEVITTPLSWVATSNVILYQRAKVVFADVDPRTGILDPEEVVKKITKKTKAILLVHMYGQMADMKRFKSIGDKYKIKIIEDTAHSLEASRDNIRPGQNGFSACLSFHVAKNITSGQGGAIGLHTVEQARIAKLLRRDGVTNTSEGKRRMIGFGYKYDATDFQAALLLNQLKRIKKQHQERMRVFNSYRKAFSGVAGVKVPNLIFNSIHAGHMFIVWVDPEKRDILRAKLLKKGIQTSVHYDPIHLEPYYQERFGYKKGDFPIAEKLGESTITLPTYSKLTRSQQEYVIRNVTTINSSL